MGASAPNPNYIPNLIAAGSAIPLGALAPNYRTPYSIQMNAGIQRQLMPGMVLSVDYLRNVNLHYLIGVDVNHSGDTRFFDKTAALNAISLTNSQFGCGTGTDPGKRAAMKPAGKQSMEIQDRIAIVQRTPHGTYRDATAVAVRRDGAPCSSA